MKYFFFILIIISVFVSVGYLGTAQGQTPSIETIIPVNFRADDLSDSQVRDIMQRIQSSGLTDEQIRQAAVSKGASDAEVGKLLTRINALKTVKDVTPNSSQAVRQVNGAEKKAALLPAQALDKGVLPIFGADLFSSGSLTFEPNLRLPTPQNYKLGPDDQIIINVFGNSQVDWRLNITPDGNIQIPGVGLVSVSGKTIEQATAMIRSKLIANHYAIGSGTSLAVSLGNIRSIKVILIGEIVKPGTYTLSSLSTVFNALSASGGPNANGSLRQIEVIRDSKLIKTLDVYDFLLKGSQKDNIVLTDGDIIRVPTYKIQVSLRGQVKRPAIYEVLPGENLNNVIKFAGGYADLAYTASMKVTQITDKERRVIDVSSADFNNYVPLRGDQYMVDKILDRFENRIFIKGAVFRPGQYELEKGLTLSQLITKAAGLKEDAFAGRGFITRLKSDNTTESISFEVRGVVSKTSPDIQLQREDIVTIPSIFDLRDDYKVSILGEVRRGGEFAYAENMSVEDLIIKAGGFTESASPKRIEISRRINTSDPNQKNSPISEVFNIDVDKNFKQGSALFALKPFDVVSVYTLPGYEKQKTVKIEGEVLYPGFYTLRSKDEKISDLVKRAGGLTASADIEGGRLKRMDNFGVDTAKSKTDLMQLSQERANRMQQIQKSLKDSTTTFVVQSKNEYVGIDLKKIINSPGSKIDLILQEGDDLFIPKEQQLVKVDGEVFFPSSVVFTGSKSLASYVNNAGGFSPSALRRRAYVVYSNGFVKATHNFLFFKSYPKVKAGSEIVVPKKPEGKGVSATAWASIAGTLASAAAVLIGVISIVKK